MSLAPDTVINGYIFIRKLGSGAFASVWLAKHQITKLEVAIKAIERASIKTKDMKTRFEREISLLKKMHHPFIIEFIDAFDNDEYHFIAMEYAENGSILEYVNSKCGLAEAHARIYFSELIFALEYLHLDQFIAHRDLKSENVLLDRYNNIRIIDFGLSNQFSETQPNLKTKCGSPGMLFMILNMIFFRLAHQFMNVHFCDSLELFLLLYNNIV
ncbi:hypothetical protein TRFO_40423 [Tritrichomonas foetus]|uniref:Protein kinase domain-containing protein n=1 Tax=Tritrichomonas foetus TaxID=1144522 RepID=A0A1J4J6I2_9EUKA|nr:hypothetical protein TRFO_40423 [Tritrichomonas foetus]|eukprot:OHS93267.1 hypothetical protein TRFO_40423 [Tritrichomonas foetus]